MIFRSSTPKFIYLCPKCMEIRITGNARAESKNSGFYCSKCKTNSTKYLEYINLGTLRNNENLDCILELKVSNKEAFIIL